MTRVVEGVVGRVAANIVEPDEAAREAEPPYLGLHCLQIQLLSFWRFRV